jgi:hypothetical protein
MDSLLSCLHLGLRRRVQAQQRSDRLVDDVGAMAIDELRGAEHGPAVAQGEDLVRYVYGTSVFIDRKSVV